MISDENWHRRFVTCLLPDKTWFSKKKANVIRNTDNPVWDEVHVFEKLNLNERECVGF